MIVIPDSIEPLTGYKWLQLHDGELTSNYDRFVWPVREAATAVCIRNWGHEWQPRPWHQQRKRIKLPDEAMFQGFNAVATKQARYGIGEEVFYGTAPKKPKIKLPPSLKWSLEDKHPDHAAPGPACTCGIYSLATRGKDLGRYRAETRAVLVEIATWGTVIPAETGNRAQYAYPTKILDFTTPLTYFEMGALAKLYGIPLEPQIPKSIASSGYTVTREKKKKRSLW